MLKKLLLAILIVSFTFSGLQPALAREPARPELTLNEAIEKAIKHSEVVKKADLEIDRTEALRDEASDQLDFIPTVGDVVYYDPQFEIAWASLLQADLTWRMSKKSYDARLDGIALDTYQLYWNVLKARESVEVKEIVLEQARLELQQSRAAYQHGIVAKFGQGNSAGTTMMALDQAEAAMDKAESDLAAAQNELDHAYTEFNQLVGLWPEDRPVLVDELEFHPLEVTNLDTEVNRALENSPSVWLAEQGVQLQEYINDLAWAKGQYTPYDAREAELEQAELDAQSAKDATRLLVRDLYYTLKNLEESYKSAEKGVTRAEEELKTKELMYQAGVAGKLDVAAAEVALAEAEQLLKELAAQHAYTKLLFQKPWAPAYSTLGGTSGSSGK
ncbi:TolC family protein [Desulfoscipio geothermicus]|uniref:Outer membrane efflux protein n=1 Tax=Desulfoscipio geothermicus DSM 3669 TaxID=1121426 RepID=A0A1I6D1S2_9FIRM|nr:TolC family protein [Desulfoscipio geothermicus]SFQ99444.1 Outer membrane efflux protein [Desulfoscipio geothermicus DSM 3669]